MVIRKGNAAVLKAFNIAGCISFLLKVIISITVIKLIYPSLLSVNTVLVFNKLGYSDSSSNGN